MTWWTIHVQKLYVSGYQGLGWGGAWSNTGEGFSQHALFPGASVLASVWYRKLPLPLSSSYVLMLFETFRCGCSGEVAALATGLSLVSCDERERFPRLSFLLPPWMGYIVLWCRARSLVALWSFNMCGSHWMAYARSSPINAAAFSFTNTSPTSEMLCLT